VYKLQFFTFITYNVASKTLVNLCIRFDTVHECDGQTDGWTDRQVDRIVIAHKARFTLGVFYDRHAGCINGFMQPACSLRAGCIRSSTLDFPTSTPCMQVACRLHTPGLSGVVDAGQSSVDDGLSSVDPRMHRVASCQSI